MTNEGEARRLQVLYRAMSNEELQALLGDRAALTVVAQHAVDAEAGVRGFVLPADDAPSEVTAVRSENSVDDDGWVALISFSVMTEALQAVQLLESQEIPFRLEDEHHIASSGMRRTQFSLLYLWVEQARRAEVVALLQAKLKLFPAAEVDEHADSPDDEGSLMQLGEFDSAEDAAAATSALQQAGIWFRAEVCSMPADPDHDTPAGDRTLLEVRLEDMERAGEVVEAAFAQG